MKEFIVFGGLYIYKDEDPYSDGMFKSLLYLDMKGDDLFLTILNGPNKDIDIMVTLEDLEEKFIAVRKFLDNSSHIYRRAFRRLKSQGEKLDLSFTEYVHVGEEDGKQQIANVSEYIDQYILNADYNNVLVYLDHPFEGGEDDTISGNLGFLNTNYLNTEWNCYDEKFDFYDNDTDIIIDLMAGNNGLQKFIK